MLTKGCVPLSAVTPASAPCDSSSSPRVPTSQLWAECLACITAFHHHGQHCYFPSLPDSPPLNPTPCSLPQGSHVGLGVDPTLVLREGNSSPGVRGNLQSFSDHHGGLAHDWLRPGHVIESWKMVAERESVRVEGMGPLRSFPCFQKAT